MQQRKHANTASLLTLTALVALLALAGCAPRAAQNDPFVVADLFATPGRSLATIVLSPTPEPTLTLPGEPAEGEPGAATRTPAATLPLPTAILLQPTMPFVQPGPTPTRAIDAAPTSTPVPVCDPPPAPFDAAWLSSPEAQALLGCPAGAPQRLSGVWQPYERGSMFWREQDRSIFVISEAATLQGQATDSWWRFDDSYQEGEPEDSMGLTPPEGMSMPVRGFGKVWRANGFVRDALGWATGSEAGAETTWLQFDTGWMMASPGGGPIYALIPLDAPPHAAGYHFGAMLR